MGAVAGRKRDRRSGERSRHPVLGEGAALMWAWRGVIGAGFALPRDAGRRPALQAVPALLRGWRCAISLRVAQRCRCEAPTGRTGRRSLAARHPGRRRPGATAFSQQPAGGPFPAEVSEKGAAPRQVSWSPLSWTPRRLRPHRENPDRSGGLRRIGRIRAPAPCPSATRAIPPPSPGACRSTGWSTRPRPGCAPVAPPPSPRPGW